MLDYQSVELFISCRNLASKDLLSKSDSFAKVELHNGKDKKKLGKTETQDNNSNPNFVKSFQFNYIFEIKQVLEIDVCDKDDITSNDTIGKIKIPVGTIAGAKNQIYATDLTNSSGKHVGKIILKLTQAKHSIYHIFWQWQGIKLKDVDFGFWDKSDPFLIFYRQEQQDWLPVHKTEQVMDNLNPVFKPFTVDIAKLCDSNYDCPIKIECFDWQSDGKHRLIGETVITLNKLLKEKQQEFVLTHHKFKNPGKIQVVQSNIIEKYSFIDYLQGGTQLNMMVAIDFTGSNQPPSNKNSLHYLAGNNQYKSALSEVCEILLQYDYDKKVPLYGFGALPKGQNSVNHCFAMTGDETNFEVFGLQGILESYEKTVHTCSFSGPTYFSPILEKAMQFSEFQAKFGVYTVLLILTDGEIHDMDKVIKLLVNCANLPLSVVIIGVGDEEFEKMEILDGDKGLKGAGPNYRDLVQFVKFKKHQHDLSKLAEKVLGELPKQLVSIVLFVQQILKVEFMKRQGIKPQPPQNVQMSQFQV